MAWLRVWKTFLRRQKRQGWSRGSLGIFVRRYLRALAYVFNVHTLVLMGVACLSVAVCYENDFRYNMDFTLVATGTTFPLVFTIQQAFARRERATVLIANMKASLVALYYMHRDWDQSENFPHSLGNNKLQWAQKVKAVLEELCLSCSRYLTAQDKYESIAERRLVAKKNDELFELFVHKLDVGPRETPHFTRRVWHAERQDPGHVHLMDCYRALSLLSVFNEQLTLKAGYTRGGEGGMSRTNQYLRYIISNLEELRMIREYRTPYMMRTACGILLHIFAIILAPYFAHFCDSWINLGNDEDTCPAGYAAAIVYVMIVMLLYHIQVDIEMPFDEKGLDDVFFMTTAELDESMGMHPSLSRRSSMDMDSVLGGMSPRESSRTNLHGMGMGMGMGGMGGVAMGSMGGMGGDPFAGYSPAGTTPHAHGHSHHHAFSAKDLQSGKPLRTIPSDHELRDPGGDEAEDPEVQGTCEEDVLIEHVLPQGRYPLGSGYIANGNGNGQISPTRRSLSPPRAFSPVRQPELGRGMMNGGGGYGANGV